MKVIIDPGSGFCGGVIRAISRAEEFLSGHPRLYSLGEMVHNEAELTRLESKGLVSVGRDALSSLPAGESVLIRAHGEPPSTYEAAAHLNIIDCTCPVVLKIQKSIREANERLAGKGTIVIFGKIGHPEVLGLVGQTGEAGQESAKAGLSPSSLPAEAELLPAERPAVVVVENMRQLQQAVSEARIAAPVEVFSQTTKSPVEYGQICSVLQEIYPDTVVHNTICSQVAERHRALSEFAANHDVIVFVAGRQSSNGRVLFELCRSVNSNSYLVGDVSELRPLWFEGALSVGVCGATSTPKWLLEQVADAIKKLD